MGGLALVREWCFEGCGLGRSAQGGLTRETGFLLKTCEATYRLVVERMSGCRTLSLRLFYMHDRVSGVCKADIDEPAPGSGARYSKQTHRS